MIEEMKGVDSNIESDVVDWEIASDEEVLAISKKLIEQNKEAYEVLGQ